MGNEKKPVHTVLVRVKVFADTKEEAEAFVERYMRVGGENCIEYEPLTHKAIKHWQFKK